MADRVDLYQPGQRLAVYGITTYTKKGASEESSFWTKIGTAHVNRDGSLNLFLDYLPNRDQTLQVRPVQEREEGGRQSGDGRADRTF